MPDPSPGLTAAMLRMNAAMSLLLFAVEATPDEVARLVEDVKATASRWEAAAREGKPDA